MRAKSQLGFKQPLSQTSSIHANNLKTVTAVVTEIVKQDFFLPPRNEWKT